MLQAAQYSVPQFRKRAYLFLAAPGYQLPTPPAPRVAIDGRDQAKLFVTLGEDPRFHAGRWRDVICDNIGSAPAVAAAEGGSAAAAAAKAPLAVTVAEALGDLPAVLHPNVRDKSEGLDSVRYDPCQGWMPHAPGRAAAAAGAAAGGGSGKGAKAAGKAGASPPSSIQHPSLYSQVSEAWPPHDGLHPP